MLYIGYWCFESGAPSIMPVSFLVRRIIMQTQQQHCKQPVPLQGTFAQKPVVLKPAVPGLRFGKVKLGKDSCGY